MKAQSLVIGQNYLFHYPFEGTPCFLINLGQPTGQNVQLRAEGGRAYEWPAGVGPQRAVVDYSAICSHRMAYPTRQISFIAYRERSSGSAASRPNTIYCCAEHSQYDPAYGARVVSGPAPQPLSAILLEYVPATDGLHAVGTLGGEMFDAFFAKYGRRLALDYGDDLARQRVRRQRTVVRREANCAVSGPSIGAEARRRLAGCARVTELGAGRACRNCAPQAALGLPACYR